MLLCWKGVESVDTGTRSNVTQRQINTGKCFPCIFFSAGTGSITENSRTFWRMNLNRQCSLLYFFAIPSVLH
uniref:Uncharacterized protein n=1 Tax=Nothoprocta perdicaria TaxID=30464 RepID=A0A8C6Z205_NOTPE